MIFNHEPIYLENNWEQDVRLYRVNSDTRIKLMIKSFDKINDVNHVGEGSQAKAIPFRKKDF